MIIFPRAIKNMKDSDDKGKLAEKNSNINQNINYIEKNNVFKKKFINIIDPMCPHNNLGISVNQINANRIKLAFQYFKNLFSKFFKKRQTPYEIKETKDI